MAAAAPAPRGRPHGAPLGVRLLTSSFCTFEPSRSLTRYPKRRHNGRARRARPGGNVWVRGRLFSLLARSREVSEILLGHYERIRFETSKIFSALAAHVAQDGGTRRDPAAPRRRAQIGIQAAIKTRHGRVGGVARHDRYLPDSPFTALPLALRPSDSNSSPRSPSLTPRGTVAVGVSPPPPAPAEAASVPPSSSPDEPRGVAAAAPCPAPDPAAAGTRPRGCA